MILFFPSNSPSPLTTLLPPNTRGDIAPSSSGIATIMVFSTGSKPALDFSHSSRDWNSNGLAERYGTFNFARIDFAASESLYAGPPPMKNRSVTQAHQSFFFSRIKKLFYRRAASKPMEKQGLLECLKDSNAAITPS